MKKFILFPVILIMISALPTSSQQIIQTQLSSDGNLEASLIDAKVKRGVLTVKVILKNPSSNHAKIKFNYHSVFYTDVQEKKKYYVLKDADGSYIAGPKYDRDGGGRFWFNIKSGEKKIIWMKFPAPLEATQYIDIFIPGILPFEEVNILR